MRKVIFLSMLFSTYVCISAATIRRVNVPILKLPTKEIISIDTGTSLLTTNVVSCIMYQGEKVPLTTIPDYTPEQQSEMIMDMMGAWQAAYDSVAPPVEHDDPAFGEQRDALLLRFNTEGFSPGILVDLETYRVAVNYHMKLLATGRR